MLQPCAVKKYDLEKIKAKYQPTLEDATRLVSPVLETEGEREKIKAGRKAERFFGKDEGRKESRECVDGRERRRGGALSS